MSEKIKEKYEIIDEKSNINFVIEKFRSRFYFIETDQILIIKYFKSIKGMTKEYIIPEFLKNFLTIRFVIIVGTDWIYLTDPQKRAYIFRSLFRLKYNNNYYHFKPYEVKTFKELFSIIGVDPKDGEKVFQ